MSAKKPSQFTSRDIALEILTRRGQEYVEEALEKALARSNLSPADRRLCQELVYGVVRWQATLDWLIRRKTGHGTSDVAPVRAQLPIIQNVLRLGLYQIFWLQRIPNHAAVHESVELAKGHGLHGQARFVNALLRGYLREADGTRALLAQLKTEHPAPGYSHPEWLVQRWQDRWGADSTVQLMDWNNHPAKLMARVNLLKADPAKLIEQWRSEGVEYDFFRRDWLEENLVFELKSLPRHLSALPSFQQGLFYVQDPSTLLAVGELAPQPGETVLDLCAAPGGKLTYAAQIMSNQGRLVAHDADPARLKLVEENCARLGITCVELLRTEPSRPAGSGAAKPPAVASIGNWQTFFDRILIDAPCSNTGVMRRRVDLRWRLRAEEINRLRGLQLDLLSQAAPLLKPGGTLVYSTCSLEPEENQGVIKDFLAARPTLKLENERELLPFRDLVDGAYVARVRRMK